MNAAERVALAQGAAVLTDLGAEIDARTLEILDRRRKTATIRRRGWLIRRMLLLADIVGLTLAFVVAEMALGVGRSALVASQSELFVFLFTLPGWIVVAKLYGLYDRDEERTDHSTADDFAGVFHLVTVGVWLLLAGGWATGLADPDLPKLLLFWLLAIALVTGGRLAARGFCRRSITYLQNAVIVGAGDVGQLVARKFMQQHGVTYPIVHDNKYVTYGTYGLTGLPETFFVDPRGRVVGHYAGQVTDSILSAGIERALRT
jgi:hypothetical protein